MLLHGHTLSRKYMRQFTFFDFPYHILLCNRQYLLLSRINRSNRTNCRWKTSSKYFPSCTRLITNKQSRRDMHIRSTIGLSLTPHTEGLTSTISIKYSVFFGIPSPSSFLGSITSTKMSRSRKISKRIYQKIVLFGRCDSSKISRRTLVGQFNVCSFPAVLIPL